MKSNAVWPTRMGGVTIDISSRMYNAPLCKNEGDFYF